MSWETAPGNYWANSVKIKDMLVQHLGPEHRETINKLTGRKSDNHGNWRLNFAGRMQFRYKKDLTWFLLVAGELKDIDVLWKWVTK
jgi:hypothetical protein